MPIPSAVWNTIKSDMHAVTVLTQSSCDTHALALVFSSIDKMAWLTSANIDHTRNDFIRWVDDYLLPAGSVSLNAIDLYAARCGFLHTGSSESKLFRDGKAKQIFYSVGPRKPQAEVLTEVHSKLPKLGLTPDDVVVVQCIELLEQWVAAMQRFTDAIKADASLEAHTKGRAELQLAVFPVA
ncbi:hypothetical protein IMW75_24780 [Pseudomonas gregormendelii]|uniref:Uncharacterized protein n=1 Tax=Pseudomonas gregormendelii TaxID=1628277 RepID=A0ABS3AMR6_9PSED|nr:hypothetical protein [Pseudomonas gregormendelii]MBN3968473.1 hypothetical protein [Pseudomonas gregormendelii]